MLDIVYGYFWDCWLVSGLEVLRKTTAGESHWCIGKYHKLDLRICSIFICTFLCLIVDCCSDEEHENSCTSVLSLLSTVSEDLPQISLAIYVAWNTSHVISWVQIGKALYGIIEPCIRAGNIFTEIDKKVYNRNSDIECMKKCEMLLCYLLCLCGVILFFSILSSK